MKDTTKPRMSTTSVQLSSKQFETLDKIRGLYDNKNSYAEILRTAFDFYIKSEYPELVA